MAEYRLSQNPNVANFVLAGGGADYDTFIVDTAFPSSLSIYQQGSALVISDGTNTAVLGNVKLQQVSSLQFQTVTGSVIRVGDDSVALGDEAGNDISGGQGGNDFLLGLGGDDTVTSVIGDDLIFGNAGNDYVSFISARSLLSTGSSTVFGGKGNDTISLFGAQGNNLVFGNNDDDTIYLDNTPGNHTVYGGQGNDVIGLSGGGGAGPGTGNLYLSGDLGADSITGGTGNDTLLGGDARDTLYGGAGADVLFGNLVGDLLDGDDGNDTLYGGQGDDGIYGGNGDDVLYGDLGSDGLVGGFGADRYVFGANSGNDRITEFNAAEGDRLDLQGQTYQLGDEPGPFNNAYLVLSGGGTITLLAVAPEEVNDSFFTS